MPSFEEVVMRIHKCGQGGIWLLLDAPSCAEAQRTFPQLIVYTTRPPWMSADTESAYRKTCEEIGFRWSVLSPAKVF
jgi:hypothetical protein